MTIALLAVVSFKKTPSPIGSGTYGVCDCDDETSNVIRLTINENNTFHYVDHSDPAKKLDITGEWAVDGKDIVLKNYQAPFNIHSRWSLAGNQNCIKSRKGMNFRRLCKIKNPR